MKRIYTYLFFLFFLVGIISLSSCSTKRNTFASRSFHNVVSRYNIYFNGNEALKSGEKKIEAEAIDDYAHLLPVYKSALPETENLVASNMDYAIAKSDKLIKLHSITAKPKRKKNRSAAYKKLANKKEYNNWVDDSHILSGKAHYYLKDYIEAADEFDYVLRNFPEQPEVYYQALIWLLRCYTPLKMDEQAEEIIAEIEGSLQFPATLNTAFDMAAAEYYMQQGNYEVTISHLEKAILNAKDKNTRARCHYILAQLYEQKENHTMAARHYAQVAKMNVAYQMSFSAELGSLELSANKTNLNEVQAQLKKMLKNQRNRNYRDQIFFALAKTALITQNDDTAVSYLRESVAAYTDNDNQLILSCTTLGDLYYAYEEYMDMRTYYDTLFSVIPENYPNYNTLAEQYTGLKKLTDNLIIVQREDSLQQLALMNDADRNKLIDNWIKQKQEKSQYNKLAIQKSNSNAAMLQNNRGSNNQAWYFYNPQTVALGKQQFINNWGKRRLEDNWRRKDKRTSLFEEENTNDSTRAIQGDSLGSINRTTNNIERDFYLQNMPKTDADWQASNNRIIEALFRAGSVFKQDFNSYRHSIDTYEDLLNRFQDNLYRLPIYFSLWDSYQAIHDQTKANYYKSLVLKQYPNSKYAKYLENPNYFVELEAHRAEVEHAYLDAVDLYQQGNYTLAEQKAKQILSLNPDSTLIPKLKFIQLIGENKTQSKEIFDTALAKYAKQYPKSKLSNLADNIRALLQDDKFNDYQSLLASGYISKTAYQQEEDNKDTEGFISDNNAIHFFVIAYDNNTSIDINRLKFDIANYNIDHYLKTDFDMGIDVLNVNTSALLVKTFLDKDQALVYLRSIIREPQVFKQLENTNYHNFVISSGNYRLLKENGDLNKYLTFYKQHYSKFTKGNFPEEELLSPEELMSKLEQEKEEPENFGHFVLIDTETPTKNSTIDENKVNTTEIDFSKEPKTPHQLVIAIKDKNKNLESILRELRGFNGLNFNKLNLNVSKQVLGEYQLITISKLADAEQAMNYFRKVIITRSLFMGLGNINYRNFVISLENREKITNEQLNIDKYTKFFREYYLSGEYKE
ncbi:MAG: hypothetical protein ACK5MI_08750 [Mangrovibacterium sp.]